MLVGKPHIFPTALSKPLAGEGVREERGGAGSHSQQDGSDILRCSRHDVTPKEFFSQRGSTEEKNEK